MEKLKNFLTQHPKARILDVGTGRGNFIGLIDYLFKGYDKIVGIDIHGPSINLAKKYFESNDSVEIINQNINDEGLEFESFDIVCLSNSLHHLEDSEKTFRSMESLVKPGGYLLFNEMMKDNLNERQISHKLLHHFSAKIDRANGEPHGDTFDRQEIVDVIKMYTSFEVIDFWDMEVPKEEPTEEQTSQFAKTVDFLKDRIKNQELKDSLKEEAEAIKKYILSNGVEGCTQLLVLARK